MTRPTAFPTLTLASVLVLLSSCSGKEPAAPAVTETKGTKGEPKALATKLEAVAREAKASDSTLAKFVPAGTAIYIQAPSVDRLATAVREISAVFAPDGQGVDVDEVLADLPGSTKDIDRSKPLAICLVLSEHAGGEPTPTFLVPTTSPENFVRSVTESGMGFTTATHGNYVSVTMGPPVAAGTSPAAIAMELPDGDVVARIDVKRLVAHYRPMIDQGLTEMTSAVDSMPPEAMAGMNMGPFMKSYADGVRSIVDSGETLDLALRVDGTLVELASDFTAREGSVLDGFGSDQKTDAKELARFLDTEAPFCVVMGMDQAAMLKRLQPLIDAAFTMYPEPMRSSFQKMTGSFDEIAKQLGSAVCANGAFGADGLRYAGYFKAQDASKFLEAYRKMMTSMTGITFEEMKEGEVAGVKVLRSRVKVDVEAMMGSQLAAAGEESAAQIKEMVDRMYGVNGLALTIAPHGEVTAIVLGGDDAFLESSLARLSKPSSTSKRLAHGLEEVGDLNPCFVMQYNLGAMMQGMQQLMGPAAAGMPPFPAMDASFTIWGGVDGRTWHGAMSTDVKELANAFRTGMGMGLSTSEEQTAVHSESNVEAQMDLLSISMALDHYATMNNGTYPESLDVLVMPDTNGNAFLSDDSVLKDPWGREYRYEAAPAGRPKPRVYTYGRDGQRGGEGEDADLDNSAFATKGR